MKTSLFQSAQRIIAQTLQWLTLSTDSSIAFRVSDTFQNGVCYNELNSMAIIGKDGDPTLPTFFTVEVQTGVSYVAGERTAILDSPLIAYNAANPSQTTDDGTGLFVPTPQSTGSYAIPLTAGFVNYLYIAYLGTIDTTVFTLNDITLGKQFYKQDDGYQIVVNTTGINPDSTLYILLGQVDLTGSNQAVSSNISIVNRPHYKTLLNRVGIQTNNNGRTDRPASYAIGLNDYFLDDHIKATGTGIISPINAHGLSLADLGVNANDTVEFHRIHEHVNGIIAGSVVNPFPTASAFFAQRIQVTPGDDFIVIQALITNEVAVVDGVAYTSAQFGSSFTIPFTGNPAGVYNIYFDGTTFGITQSDISTDETKLWLATTTWTPIPGDGNLTLPADRRQLGTLDLLERWVTAGRPQNPISGNFGYNIDLNQLEYWNGTSWQQPITVASNSVVPTGALLPFAGSSAPAGFLLADGSSYSIISFATLFSVIGYTYGGSGANFNVPNLINTVPVGIGGSIVPTLGATAGSATHTLSVSEIPAGLTVTDPTHHHTYAVSGPVNSGLSAGSFNFAGTGTGFAQAANTSSSATGISVGGGGAAHSVVQPSLGINYIIKI